MTSSPSTLYYQQVTSFGNLSHWRTIETCNVYRKGPENSNEAYDWLPIWLTFSESIPVVFGNWLENICLYVSGQNVAFRRCQQLF